jgi:hypothetical protein
MKVKQVKAAAAATDTGQSRPDRYDPVFFQAVGKLFAELLPSLLQVPVLVTCWKNLGGATWRGPAFYKVKRPCCRINQPKTIWKTHSLHWKVLLGV